MLSDWLADGRLWLLPGGGCRRHDHRARSMEAIGIAKFAAARGEPLRHAEPDAVILPARQHGHTAATTAAEVAAGEPVILAYTCTDLYYPAYRPRDRPTARTFRPARRQPILAGLAPQSQDPVSLVPPAHRISGTPRSPWSASEWVLAF